MDSDPTLLLVTNKNCISAMKHIILVNQTVELQVRITLNGKNQDCIILNGKDEILSTVYLSSKNIIVRVIPSTNLNYINWKPYFNEFVD